MRAATSGGHACSRWARSTVCTHVDGGAAGASELVFSDFASDRHLHEPGAGGSHGAAPVRLRRLREARGLLELAPFDLVFFLGVLYHSIHLPAARDAEPRDEARRDDALRDDGGPAPRCRRPAPLVRDGKAKAVPSVQAVRVELAWTGWRRVTRFTDYRPGSTEALFLCEKTDELRGRRPRAGRQSAPPPLTSARGNARIDSAERVRPCSRAPATPATQRSRCWRTCAARMRSSPSSAPALATSARASARSTSSSTSSAPS